MFDNASLAAQQSRFLRSRSFVFDWRILLFDFCYLMGAFLPGPYIRNTPKRPSGSGALNDAESASARAMRVSVGSMMPSSQRRALA